MKLTALALVFAAQVLFVGCSTQQVSLEDESRLAKAEKMANRFETRPRTNIGPQ